MDLLLTVEQVELIRRLKRTGIQPDRVVEAFRQIERFECELEIWSSRLHLRQREEVARQLQLLQRFSSLTSHGATTSDASLHNLLSASTQTRREAVVSSTSVLNDDAHIDANRPTTVDFPTLPTPNNGGGVRAMEILRTLLSGPGHVQSAVKGGMKEQPGGVVLPGENASLPAVQRLLPPSILHSMTVPIASNASSWVLSHGMSQSTAVGEGGGADPLMDLQSGMIPGRVLRQALFTSPPASNGGNHSTSAVHGSPPSSACSTRSGVSTTAGNENAVAAIENGVEQQQGQGSRANSSRPIRSQRTPMKEITTLDDPHELEEFMLAGEEACIADMRQFIQQFSLRQTTVALMTGVSQPYISKLLNGNHRELSLRCRKNIYSWYLNCRRHPEKLVTFVQDPATRLETNGETGELVPQRRERYVFRPTLIRILERYFVDSPFPDTSKRAVIANACNQVLLREKGVSQLAAKEIVTPQVIANWFANKRKEIRRKSNELDHIDSLSAAEAKLEKSGEQSKTKLEAPTSLLNGDMDVDCSCEAVAAKGIFGMEVNMASSQQHDRLAWAPALPLNNDIGSDPLKSSQSGAMDGENIDLNHNHREPSETLASYLKSPSHCISIDHNDHHLGNNIISNPPPSRPVPPPTRIECSSSSTNTQD